jgi:hypothetical protein
MLTDEHLCPVFQRAPPGADETYDTLDNIDLGGNNCVETLFDLLTAPLEGAVGVVVMGESGLSDPSEGYWGRAMPLSTGEHLQMRIHPRNSAGRPIGYDETRFLAIRRTSHGTVPHVGYGVFYLPRQMNILEGKTPLTTGPTIGCRGVHIVLPSLFSKHDPHRDKSTGHSQLDFEGFHSIRPSTLCLTINRGTAKKPDASYSFTPGDAYTVIAGHMGGTDIADPLQRSSLTMTDTDHSRRIAACQRRLVQSMGEAKAATYISSSLTLCELLSAEGTLGVMCNSFFTGAFPDMMYSPLGIPLVITMAVHVACYPELFKLPPCTKQDAFANREMIRAFRSRWDKVMLKGFRAIDVAVKSGYDNATMQANKEKEMTMHLEDNLKMWQRVGQRLISKLMSNPSDEIRGGSKAAFQTKFGDAELLMDAVSDCKYASLAKKGYFLPVREAPIDKIFTAPRADVKTTLYRVQDNAEAWLRTGVFGKHRISHPNINVAHTGQYRKNRYPCKVCGTCFRCDCTLSDATKVQLSSSSSESDDEDHIMDNNICIDAMESAAGAIAIAMLHGAYVMHQFQIKCYLVGNGCSNTCADCDKRVGVLEGTLFGSKASQCSRCNRKRCFSCTSKSLRADKSPDEHCLRCAPGAPSDYKTLPQLALMRKKHSAKK